MAEKKPVGSQGLNSVGWGALSFPQILASSQAQPRPTSPTGGELSGVGVDETPAHPPWVTQAHLVL